MGSVNWSSIEAKIASAANNMYKNATPAAAERIASEMVFAMNDAINSSSELTSNEAARVSLVPFVHVGTDVNVLKGTGGGVYHEYKLYFNFEGDKTMISLSPNKTVHDLIALFNNGYPTNNVDPEHPIRGMWHGNQIIIRPRSRKGAHFIGRALQTVKNNNPQYDISFKVNPNYNTST